MSEPRPRRSVLYMPGSNARALDKARQLPADGFIFDLEDAVAPEMKATARQQIAAAVKAGGYGQRELSVRINGLGAPGHDADLAAIGDLPLDGIVCPKVESAAEVVRLTNAMNHAGAPANTRLWIMIETPLGVLNAREIAAEGKRPGARLAGIILGTNDIAKETRAHQTADRAPMLYALQVSVLAARAYGLDILDGVYNNFRDAAGFRRECEQGLAFGFDGKTLIHPDQIALANDVFSPSVEAVAEARKILAAFARPEHQGKGAITLDGRMVELLHCEMARRTVAIADRIDGKG